MGRPGRPKTSGAKEDEILKVFKEHTDWSLRKIGKEVGQISHVTVMRILRKHKLWVSS